MQIDLPLKILGGGAALAALLKILKADKKFIIGACVVAIIAAIGSIFLPSEAKQAGSGISQSGTNSQQIITTGSNSSVNQIVTGSSNVQSQITVNGGNVQLGDGNVQNINQAPPDPKTYIDRTELESETVENGKWTAVFKVYIAYVSDKAPVNISWSTRQGIVLVNNSSQSITSFVPGKMIPTTIGTLTFQSDTKIEKDDVKVVLQQ